MPIFLHTAQVLSTYLLVEIKFIYLLFSYLLPSVNFNCIYYVLKINSAAAMLHISIKMISCIIEIVSSKRTKA